VGERTTAETAIRALKRIASPKRVAHAQAMPRSHGRFTKKVSPPPQPPANPIPWEAPYHFNSYAGGSTSELTQTEREWAWKALQASDTPENRAAYAKQLFIAKLAHQHNGPNTYY
jgi:hypothetical protein